MNISPATVRMLVNYDPESGRLVWRKRDPSFFDGSAHRTNRWNALYADKPALSANHKDGYLHGHMLTAALLAHRVAWAHQTGSWPIGQIDHIDGDRKNNRFSNLRSVTAQGNARNQKIRSNNKSGMMGVTLHKSGRWRVRIAKNGIRVHVGMFDSKDQAIAARKSAEIEEGYHPNHNRITHG